ncbi:MAG: hypothetical protein AAF907_04895, partial [Planctomycetota bacterium]
PGLKHGLRYAVKGESYARLASAVGGSAFIDGASNAVVAQYADYGFEYDGERRVTKETVDGGSRTETFAYIDNPSYSEPLPNDPYDQNAWFRKITRTRNDGSEIVLYCNAFGQTLLKSERDGTDEWLSSNRLDADGRLILKAAPSAVSGYNEALDDLVGYDEISGTATHLRAGAGLITTMTYYADPDPAAGLKHETFLKEGTLGLPQKQETLEYTSHTAGGATVHPLSKRTVYRGANGSEPVATTYATTYHSGSTQVASKTTTMPAVPVSEGGTGVAETTEEVYDAEGFHTWSKDARGYISHREYDALTGAMTRMIEDVDTAQTTDEPFGWSTPAGGGKHLVTDYNVDDRGRVTQTLGPVHDALVAGVATSVRTASWTIYEDHFRVTTSAAGYQKVSDGSFTLIDPISRTRRDRNGNVIEEITAKRTLAVQDKPTAGDHYDRTDWKAWTTHEYSDCCKLAATRVYHTIPASGEGVAGTNYDETTFGYDLRNRRNRTVSPGGTIAITLFDALGRQTASYMGTNDTGATATDPTGGGALGNDMVLLSENLYDDGQDAGDSNLTKTTVFVDASTTRVTDYAYDWRNRQIAVTGEEDSYSSVQYDNLGRALATERRLADATGRLLAKSETFYNDLGQAYKREQHEVDYDTGTVGGSIGYEYEFDAAGNVVKETPSGAADYMEYEYDSLGRRITTTDPLNHSSSTVYNDAGQAISMTDREGDTSTRDYDPIGRLAKSTDPLGNATSYGYDDAGRQTTVTDPRGHVTTTSYDDDGRVVTMTDPLSHVTSYGYDANGNQETVTNALSQTTNYEFDYRDRLVKTTDAGGAVTEQAYNRAGDLVTETDAKGNDTTHAYDGSGRRTATTDRLNNTTTFAYDALDRQISLTDAEGGVTSYAFDGYGRPASTTWPDHAPG